MHNIERISEPNILRQNKRKWTKELLDEISKKGDLSKVDDSFKKHYKHDEISDSLKKMNGGDNGYCYYCEQRVGRTDYGHIEHFKPKNKFPELFFEWENLHWSCPKCNLKKGVRWNEDHCILDPCDKNTKIGDHIFYSLWEVSGNSENAFTTIDTFLLNDTIERKELVESRKKVFLALLEVIMKVNAETDNVIKRREIEKLKRHATEFEFKGMISYVLKSLLKDDSVI